ncbi:MAG: hypothetical protein PHH98_01440 [Candidatus Gracilibacteria bacterium]|nr:hypothetical protein [Candidatus Gracilibacteria bacterium]
MSKDFLVPEGAPIILPDGEVFHNPTDFAVTFSGKELFIFENVKKGMNSILSIEKGDDVIFVQTESFGELRINVSHFMTMQ